jgi:hypothetical protein
LKNINFNNNYYLNDGISNIFLNYLKNNSYLKSLNLSGFYIFLKIVNNLNCIDMVEIYKSINFKNLLHLNISGFF